MKTDYGRIPFRDSFHMEVPELPNGASVAVWIASNHEFYEWDPPARPSRRPWPRTQPDLAEYGHRDFGNRVGVWRLFRLLDDLGLTASVSLNSAQLIHHPEIAAACLERGWELFSHGVYNTRYHLDLSDGEERRAIEQVLEDHETFGAERPYGWLSPALTNTPCTMDLLAEYGFTYTCDFFHDDIPSFVGGTDDRLLSIPYGLELNDVIAYHSYQASPQEYGQMIRRHFDVLREEGLGRPRVMCIPLHPYLVCQPHRIGAFASAIEYILGTGAAWFTRGIDIADWWLRSNSGEEV
jgi:allantoinase